MRETPRNVYERTIFQDASGKAPKIAEKNDVNAAVVQ